jgi:hypothetical protein
MIGIGAAAATARRRLEVNRRYVNAQLAAKKAYTITELETLNPEAAAGFAKRVSAAQMNAGGRNLRTGGGKVVGMEVGGRFEHIANGSTSIRDLVLRYTELVWAETQQIAACNAMHGASARLCRWLLQSADRIGSDEVPLIQEFLAPRPMFGRQPHERLQRSNRWPARNGVIGMGLPRRGAHPIIQTSMRCVRLPT